MALGLIGRIGCVVLAAGGGTRFAGGVKLLAQVEGRALLQRAVDAACGSNALTCTLVVGSNLALLSHIDARRCAVVRNDAWPEGIASSIRCGLARHAQDDACIFLAADQPFVTSADLNNLISCGSRAQGRPVIVALRAGRVWGTPMLFPRADFGKLLRLRGDRGAKRYARAHERRLRFVEALDARAFVDIDTRSDLERISLQQTSFDRVDA